MWIPNKVEVLKKWNLKQISTVCTLALRLHCIHQAGSQVGWMDGKVFPLKHSSAGDRFLPPIILPIIATSITTTITTFDDQVQYII